MRILEIFKLQPKHKLIWCIVVPSIILNLVATNYLLTTNLNLIDHPFFGLFLAPFDQVRYGHYIARKLFLVTIAFLVFGYWLLGQKGVLKAVRDNIKYVVIIGFVLFVTRILTYGFWFYNDDLRFFHYHLFAPTQPLYNPQAMWGPVGLHPIAIFTLVLSWFGTNYTLYNSLGLFLYFLAGCALFVLISKLQKSKFISLTSTLFLLTTPTYFQGRLLIGEIINSPFILLLVLLTIYMLLRKFLPGALIFFAASLEYGVAKSYFLALPLTLLVAFFLWPKKRNKSATRQKLGLAMFVIAIWSISAVYFPAFFRAPSFGNLGLTSIVELIKLDQIFVFGDVLMSVNLSYVITYPLIHLLSLIFNGWIYITVVLGFLIIACFSVTAVLSYIHDKKFSAKLIVTALSIIVPTATIASFMGVRIDHNVQKLVTYSNNGNVPSGATGYGIFPALGLVLILVALGQITKKKIYSILVVILLLLNIVGSVAADYKWYKSAYGFPQRRYNDQLQGILLRDGMKKYVFVSSQQRLFFEGVRTFSSVFQGDQGVYVFMSEEDFTEALKENFANKEQIYFLASEAEPDYQVFDYSDKIRSIPFDRLSPNLKKLVGELKL